MDKHTVEQLQAKLTEAYEILRTVSAALTEEGDKNMVITNVRIDDREETQGLRMSSRRPAF